MKTHDILRDAASRPGIEAAVAVKGLSPEALNAHPGGHPNSIAWLLWHAGRQMDMQLSALNGQPQVWEDFDDFLARSSALVGSPAEVVEKVGRYHERFGHEVTSLHFDRTGLTDAQHRATWELFTAEVAPALREAVAAHRGRG